MNRPRLWLVLGLAAAVAAIMLGYHLRVRLAGGRAVMLLALVGVLAWLALRQRDPPSRDLDRNREHVR